MKQKDRMLQGIGLAKYGSQIQYGPVSFTHKSHPMLFIYIFYGYLLLQLWGCYKDLIARKVDSTIFLTVIEKCYYLNAENI